MANSSVLMSTISETPYDLSKIKTYKVTYDSPGVDIRIFTPSSSGKSFYIKGIAGSEATVDTELDLRFKQRSPQMSGTITLTNGSTAVTGSGTTFNTDFLTDLCADTELVTDYTGSPTRYVVSSVTDDTHIVLASAFAGTTGTYNYGREDTLIQLELTTFQGMMVPVQEGAWLWAGKPGWLFTMNSNANYTQFLVHIQEGIS